MVKSIIVIRTIMHVRKPLIHTLGIVILVSWLLGGCLNSNHTPVDKNLPFTAAAQTKTSVAQTIEAQLTQIAVNPQITPTPAPLLPTELATPPAPTDTVGTPSGATAPPPSANCDRATFIADVTVPDGTVYKPGETFVKTWRLQNAGECAWNAGYAVVFDQGDAMGSPASFPLTSGEVQPGEEIEVSVTLQAPNEPGDYRGDWKLRNASGQIFGLGNSGTSSFWVLINVGSAPDFSVFFDNVHICEGVNYAIFSLFNNGDDLFQSAEITLSDTDGTLLFGPLSHNAPFLSGASECPQGGDAVEPDKKAYLGASLANATSGQNLRTTLKICTQDGLGGSCTTETLDFTMP